VARDDRPPVRITANQKFVDLIRTRIKWPL